MKYIWGLNLGVTPFFFRHQNFYHTFFFTLGHLPCILKFVESCFIFCVLRWLLKHFKYLFFTSIVSSLRFSFSTNSLFSLIFSEYLYKDAGYVGNQYCCYKFILCYYFLTISLKNCSLIFMYGYRLFTSAVYILHLGEKQHHFCIIFLLVTYLFFQLSQVILQSFWYPSRLNAFHSFQKNYMGGFYSSQKEYWDFEVIILEKKSWKSNPDNTTASSKGHSFLRAWERGFVNSVVSCGSQSCLSNHCCSTLNRRAISPAIKMLWYPGVCFIEQRGTIA